jgi:DNA-binding winged helix-turn-helix (wHTH) protein/TolB-like protein
MIRNPAKHFYEFGPFRLDPAEHSLLRDSKPVLLAPKVFDILQVLVEDSGHLFEKDELMKAVWPDSFVEEGNLTRNISTLRTALGESPDEHKYIETVPKRGYRFIAPVLQVNGFAEDRPEQHTEVTAVSIADTEAGSGAIYDNAMIRDLGSGRRVFLRYRAWAIVALATLVSLVIANGLFFRGTSTEREPEIKSLAVLPLRSLTKEKDDSYLGLGLAETIITRVSQINGLVVRPSSAIRKYNDQEINSLDAARELQVDSVLELIIQRTSDQSRVNLNLLRTRDGTSLWSDTFDLNRTDIFKMQDEVAQRVATRLRLKLRPQTASSAHAIKPEAYDYYMRAKLHTGLMNRNDNEAAIDLLEKAVAVDPNFAAAYALLSREYTTKRVSLRPQEKEWEEKAFAAVDKALSLDPDLSEAHVARALLLWTPSHHFPHQTVIEELRRALDLNPNLDEAHHQLASVYNHIGLLDKGREEIQRAVAINPANTGVRFRVGINLLYQSKYEQALVAFAETRQFKPSLWAYQTAWALFQLGRRDEAAATITEALKNDEHDEGGLLTSMEAMLAASAGENQKAEDKIKEAAEVGKGYLHFHHTAYAIASAYAIMNKPTAALEWLQKAADDGFPCYPLFARDPNLDHLRQDQRFIAFMARLKDQWERYQATL